MAHACLSLQDTRVYRKAKRPVAESANLCIDKRGEERCALIPQDLQPLVETTTTTTTATATTTTTTTVAVCKPALKIGLRVVEQCGDASNGTAVRGERGGGKWDKGVRKGEKGERETLGENKKNEKHCANIGKSNWKYWAKIRKVMGNTGRK